MAVTYVAQHGMRMKWVIAFLSTHLTIYTHVRY